MAQVTRLLLVSEKYPNSVKVRCDRCKWYDDDMCILTENNYDQRVSPDSLAYASAGKGYYAVLRTYADFGCVQFEEKE